MVEMIMVVRTVGSVRTEVLFIGVERGSREGGGCLTRSGRTLVEGVEKGCFVNEEKEGLKRRLCGRYQDQQCIVNLDLDLAVGLWKLRLVDAS